MAQVAAIVLAAGASLRLGFPKQLTRLGGETLLAVTSESRSILAEIDKLHLTDSAGNALEVGALYTAVREQFGDDTYPVPPEGVPVRYINVNGRDVFLDAKSLKPTHTLFDFLVRQNAPVIDVVGALSLSVAA